MITNSLGAHNGGVDRSIRGNTYLGGEALGTRRLALDAKSMRPCDIHLGGWKLDLRTLGLRSTLLGGWLWSVMYMFVEKHYSMVIKMAHVEKNWAHERTCGTQLGGRPCMRTLGNHHGRSSIGPTTWREKYPIGMVGGRFILGVG
jgi:hypothetical protein